LEKPGSVTPVGKTGNTVYLTFSNCNYITQELELLKGDMYYISASCCIDLSLLKGTIDNVCSAVDFLKKCAA
jgi:hypothetical protein